MVLDRQMYGIKWMLFVVGNIYIYIMYARVYEDCIFLHFNLIFRFIFLLSNKIRQMG